MLISFQFVKMGFFFFNPGIFYMLYLPCILSLLVLGGCFFTVKMSRMLQQNRKLLSPTHKVAHKKTVDIMPLIVETIFFEKRLKVTRELKQCMKLPCLEHETLFNEHQIYYWINIHWCVFQKKKLSHFLFGFERELCEIKRQTFICCSNHIFLLTNKRM